MNDAERVKDQLDWALEECPWIPLRPMKRQEEWLTDPSREAIWQEGRASGGSTVLLMAALQFADQPDYRGVIFSRTYRDARSSYSPAVLSHDWLARESALKWSEGNRRWTFPNGGTLQFDHLEDKADRARQYGAVYDFIGFHHMLSDEYLLTRFRADSPILFRVRSA